MDKFIKLEKIGKGTFGTVCLHEEKQTKHKVIIKEIELSMTQKESQIARNEISILKNLDHPNIIKYYDSYLQDKSVFIVMEYARKGNLQSYISQQRQNHFLAKDQVFYIFCQILLGLDHIHSKNIIHRDLKCENILITGFKYDLIKIADFGISKLLDSSEHASTFIGTANYMAPEICDGKSYNKKCDIWSLGCILFELCALERMFDGPVSNIVLSISTGNKKKISLEKYSHELQTLIDNMLQMEYRNRPDTTKLMANPIVIPHLYKLYVDLGKILP